MAHFAAKRIPGRWRDGYALDFHTLSSSYVGDDHYGNPQFDTRRSEVGELLYRLRYHLDTTAIPEIVAAAASLFELWNPGIELIVPVPPSRVRSMQPVLRVGSILAERLNVPFASTCVTRVREVPELKNVYDYHERLRLLAGAHTVDRTMVQRRRVLLFDDLYRSGATLNEITALLYDQGGAADVFALTLTQTRSNR